jgi:DNA-binding transcriptional regulator YiaG
MTMKTKRIVKAKLGADGKARRIGPAGKRGRVLRGRVNASLLDSPAAFEPDSDTPVLTRRELRDLQPVAVDEAPNITALRRRLHLSLGAFATLFGIPLATVKDWEQGRRRPDAPARAYLRVIAWNPKAVRSALESRR